MNKQAIYHYNESNFSFALDKENLRVRLQVAREDPDILRVECIWNVSFKLAKEQLIAPMEVKHQDDLFDYYEATLYSKDPRYSYVFKIYLKDETHYFYSELGLTRDFNFAEFDGRSFKMAYINENDISYRNPRFNGEICYQIFPERFCRGDETIDKSYITEPWDTTNLSGSYGNYRQDVFIGGDLRGIINKLGYLKSLNVGVIYMTPICKSSSNHKYDVEDYFMIDPMFGDDNTLNELVTKAHALGMKVVLDLVFNHSSHKNPMFLDVKEKGKDSKYYNFYTIYGDKVIDEEENYAKFANVKRMPKLNTNNYEVQDFLLEVGKYFLNKFHIDGYRLDVANEVSHDFWLRFKHEVRKIDRDIILIGEIWTNSYKYLSSNEFDSVMNYAFLNACKEFYVKKSLDAEGFKNRLETILMRYDDNTNCNMLNLIDSHDTPRFYEYMKPNKDAYLLAVLTLISHIGIPMVYYGDEIFMEGGYDPANRKGMEWNSKIYNTNYFYLFSQIMKLRTISAFKYGEMKLSSKDGLFIIERYDDNGKYKVLINNSQNIIEYKNNGRIILSNNYSKDMFLPYSFLIVME